MKRKIIILGAGPKARKKEGVVNVDISPFPGIDVVHDLDKRPWPFADGEAFHVNAKHVLEHLERLPETMDEIHRILSPGGSLYIEVPIVTTKNLDLAFADPTHRQFLRIHSFLNYFTVPAILNQNGNEGRYVKHAWCPAYVTPADEAEKTGILRLVLFPVSDEWLEIPELKKAYDAERY